ncbi:MAG: hypothetical protein GOV15_01865 [Candidatus Diapherotrites archaeon]|nr:hypothetical protein [Candidatus Diapherotrites archaeon]
MVERTKSGIPGLDEVLGGGFPKGSAVLIPGGPGTGKTIFCTQFLYNGAKLYGEKGIFITLEAGQANIKWNMESFGWDMKAMVDQGLLSIYHLRPKDPAQFGAQIDDELKYIESLVHKIGAQRLIIDSTTALAIWLQNPAVIRYKLMDIVERLKLLNCTTLLTAETQPGNRYSAYGVEEFVTDGVIPLVYKPPHRALFIRKMRGTNHSKKIHPLEIGPQGFVVKNKEEIMWEALKE